MAREQPYRCISCAFLCRLDPYKPVEILNTERELVSALNMPEFFYRGIRCFKHFHADFYENLKDGVTQVDMERVLTMTCPQTTDWLLHHDGIFPQRAAEQEYANKNLNATIADAKVGVKWSKWIFWAVISSIILMIIFFLLSQFVLNLA